MRFQNPALAICAFILSSFAAAQTTWYVDDDAPGDPGPGDTSISDPLEDGTLAHPFDAVQEAIDASASVDTIVIRDGEYAGVGNYNIDPAGRALTIRGENGRNSCTLRPPNSAAERAPALRVQSGEPPALLLEGLSCQGRLLHLTDGSSATVRNCEIRDAEHGILADSAGTLALEQSIVRDCVAPAYPRDGGGISWFAGGKLLVTECEFRDNFAGYSGGAIRAEDADAVIIDRCTFIGNSTQDRGGAVRARAAEVEIKNTLFRENHVTTDPASWASGGALICAGGNSLIVNCRFEGNYVVAGRGAQGGALSAMGMTRVWNCLFIGNWISDGEDGYGAALTSRRIEIVGCTFAGNRGFNQPTLRAVDLTMRNTIVWGNRRGDVEIRADEAASVEFSLVEGGWPGAGNLDADPQFLDPDGADGDPNTVGDNDYRLRSVSPCVDAGDGSAVPVDRPDLDRDGNATEPLPYDLAGGPRRVEVRCAVDSGAGGAPNVDVGAYETADFLGGDCNANGTDDCDDIASGASRDCNGNRLPDECDIAGGTSMDCDADGIPDDCEPDCNGSGVADDCDIAGGASTDCDGNGVPDECEPDCNGNGVADRCDIDAGTSADCNANGVPDECESDCNGNVVADDCDIRDGTSADCNLNGVPDDCELDCNANGVQDDCDIAGGVSLDCDVDGVPDECQPDCDGDGTPDACEAQLDCNLNGVLDECDVLFGVSADCDGDQIPDECSGRGPLTGYAIDFDAERVHIPDDPSLHFALGEPITLEAWIRPDVTEPQCVIAKGSWGFESYYVTRIGEGGRIRFGYLSASGATASRYETMPAVPEGTWRHVAVTHVFGSTTISIFVDGEPVPGEWITPPAGGPWVDGALLSIGSVRDPVQGTPRRLFDGMIDDVRLWRTLRTPAEIRGSMHTRLRGDEPGLVSSWPFDEGVDLDIRDIAGRNDGEVANMFPDWIALHYCPCPGDLNGDAAVDLRDLAVMLKAFGATGAGDVDGDDDTDTEDLAILLAAFGGGC